MLKLNHVLIPLYCPNSACFTPDVSNFSHWHKLSTKLHLDLKKESLFYFTAALNLWTCGWKSKLAAATQDQVKFSTTMPIVLEDFLTQ